MILTKEVEVKLAPSNIEYYKNLGYQIPMRKSKTKGKDYVYDIGSTIIVKLEDLPKGSESKIDILCDYCQETVFSMKYYVYWYRIENIQKCACKKCKGLKMKEMNMLKHGIPWVTHTEEAEVRRKNTMIKKYGTLNFWEIPEMKQKYIDTCMEKYNAPYYTQTEDFKRRIVESSREKYGTDYPIQNAEVKEKLRSVVNEKYGVDNVMLNKEIYEKTRMTMYQNGTCQISRQQKYLHNLYGGELNYPFKMYNLDIFLPDEKINIEYDGSGHRLSCEFGTLTQEEFDRKEIIRNYTVENAGIRVIRIISLNDLLPSDETLLQMLNESRNYFETTSHNWVTFDINNSLMLNAINKNIGGNFYDYGNKLRRIKESDLIIAKESDISDIEQTTTKKGA